MWKKILAFQLLILLLCPFASFAQAKRRVSLLLYNGKIFTADAQFTIAEAVAVDGEKIVAVGKSSDLRAAYQAERAIDLQGKLVTPGFNDAHVHFLRGALALLTVNLLDTKSVAEAQARVATKVKEVKPGEWVFGRGWDHTVWKQNFPSKKDLDPIAPNNPVYLVRVDGHVAWVNSAALRLARIDRTTPNPEGGEIEKDAQGEPTGILKETAQGLVSRLIPQPDQPTLFRGLEAALDMARRHGITSVQDNSGYETTKLYRAFLQQDKLTVRVSEWQDFEDSVETLKRQRTEFASFKDNPSRLKLGALKGYVDGTLGSRTAAMLAPFSDDAGNSGIPRRPQEELTRMIVDRDREGWQIALHAIGDRANRMALDGFESARKLRAEKNKTSDVKSGPTGGLNMSYDGQNLKRGEFIFGRFNGDSFNPLRHRVEHAQVVNPSDFRRFAELGIIASMQPSHAISDKRWAESRLGEYRVLGAYAWHFMQSYNVHVPFGTDFPVEPINPYNTLYAAVSRQDADGDPIGGWQPQERLTMAQAIRCHTYESAFAEFSEREKGEIKTGMLADLVVHSKDLLTIEPKEVLTTETVLTVFNGRVIYEKK
ncbi:MAG: amidohydrolase [Acidobacteriota bacterium]|nr:amidohydrolase [Acidobacteriota bacterium]